ncbi:YdaS family helix-turn-helix protein [Clostridium sporogenes]|uniref:YdaS family helix-turn-helix protein n=1 Tax=Clostridium sporogenes TaxID=1509 RepID=UPI0006B2808F|nr:YdaS family helix-turn-helix protein [Clostridium sporogenes]KOY66340.1 hypothetical protein AN649_08535 [Clostridium sporogenes]
MKGIEYVLALYNMPHTELARELGITRQNINQWVKGKGKIPKKYLPVLSKMFNVPEEYFQKEINDIDKLIIQKEKLKMELKPSINEYQLRFSVDTKDLEEEPVYNFNELNQIELEIKKAKIIEDIRGALSSFDNDIELQIFEQIALLLKKYRTEKIFGYTVDAVSHYYSVLPEWVGDPESDDFVEEFLELAQKYDGTE